MGRVRSTRKPERCRESQPGRPRLPKATRGNSRRRDSRSDRGSATCQPRRRAPPRDRHPYNRLLRAISRHESSRALPPRLSASRTSATRTASRSGATQSASRCVRSDTAHRASPARRIGFRSIHHCGTNRLETSPQLSGAAIKPAPECAEDQHDKDPLLGIGAYCGERAGGLGGSITGQQRTSKPSTDCFRGRRVRRLPRGDGSPRLPARTARLAAVRRQRPALSPAGRARLDRPRSANSSLVNGNQGARTCEGGRMSIRRRCRGACRSSRRCLEHLWFDVKHRRRTVSNAGERLRRSTDGARQTAADRIDGRSARLGAAVHRRDQGRARSADRSRPARRRRPTSSTWPAFSTPTSTGT